MTGKAAYLKTFDRWLRDGRPGLAPSPLPFGILSGDCIRETSELEAAQRRETGRSNWGYYDPAFYGPFMASLREAAAKREERGSERVGTTSGSMRSE